MSGKKHVFKMIPGQEFRCGPGSYENWLNFDDPQSMRKVKLIPLSEEGNDLELPIKFCSDSFTSGQKTYCIEEENNDRISVFANIDEPGYYENSSAFAYDNDRLIQLSAKISFKDSTYYYNIRAEKLKYEYLTWEESDTGDSKYYFSDEEGNVIDSTANEALRYSMPHYDTEKMIEDITSSKIPKSVLISNKFAKTFFKNLTENQLETLADTLNNEKLQILVKNLTDKQLQVLAEHLTDGQFQALVDHLTNHQLQTLAQELNPEKLQIIVPILNDAQLGALVRDLNSEQVKEILPHLKVDQFKALINNIENYQLVELAKDLDENHLTILSKELWSEQLPTLVHALEGDKLHNLIKNLDYEKLVMVARDLTDTNKIQMIIESLADDPVRLQAFAHNMPDQQFAKLLNELNAESLKDIIHKLPYEKVTAVIGDVGNKDQSNATIEMLKQVLEEKSKEYNERQEEMMKMLKKLKPTGDEKVNIHDETGWHAPYLQDTGTELMMTEEYI